ncbi:hypothetical protein GTO91_11525 [Heliobacterium undosum]|uniref:Uncharacterized protein n=1 Tax=Heliomicrobium undosum TaxID=121734 RepID=A0A845LBP2_9FIRM|nr:immunity 26/phosphotriesterase HocA family protein [Heliomicrobium undosum]MZP30341.1 hypothetical protein [Heliomicrobium undosum]
MLVKMKPSRKKPKSGDVFVIQPKEGIYVYGKVIKADLASPSAFIQGQYLVFIYHTVCEKIVQPVELNPQKLLFQPLIVSKLGWTMGFYQTVYSTKVTQEDHAVDYGFYDADELNVPIKNIEKFVDEECQPLGYQPKLWDQYALSSYGYIGRLVHKALALHVAEDQ